MGVISDKLVLIETLLMSEKKHMIIIYFSLLIVLHVRYNICDATQFRQEMVNRQGLLPVCLQFGYQQHTTG